MGKSSKKSNAAVVDAAPAAVSSAAPAAVPPAKKGNKRVAEEDPKQKMDEKVALKKKKQESSSEEDSSSEDEPVAPPKKQVKPAVAKADVLDKKVKRKPASSSSKTYQLAVSSKQHGIVMAEETKVKLGNQGLKVSKLGFGCMGLTGDYKAPLSVEDVISIIKDAFNKGITFFDTADIYGEHDNEVLVGKALKQLPREKIQLATKFGIGVDSNYNTKVDGTPEYVRSCCEASLKRLDVDYIDLYYQHRVDTRIPIEETMGELKKLVEEGKIKYIGLSEASPDTIRRAHAVHPITALQMEWSLWTRDIEEEIVPLCRELGIGIVSYSPLGLGFFGGKAVVESLPKNSCLVSHPRFVGKNLDKNKILYTRMATLASKHGCTPAQLALAWVLHQGDDVVPIPGTTKIKNLNDNIGSIAVKLSEANMKEITEAVPIEEVAGSRNYKHWESFSWNYADTPAAKDKMRT